MSCTRVNPNNNAILLPTALRSQPHNLYQYGNRQGDERPVRWNLQNSSGYGCNGSVIATCVPTMDNGQFASANECVMSAQAGFNTYPNPDRKKVWIITNPVLEQCMETEDYPMTFTKYGSFQECKAAAQAMNKGEQQVTAQMGALAPARFYLDSNRNQCASTSLTSAPFSSMEQCQLALNQVNPMNMQPMIQYSNPTQAVDHVYNLRAPRKPLPLNPVDRAPIISNYDLMKVAGQGYNT